MSIDLLKPIPLYRQIADDIKSEISSGKIGIGAQIGTHQELVEKYSVSLITVKRAVSELITEGIVYSRVGKGTYVHAVPGRKNIVKDQTIGLVLKDLKSPFFSMIVHSIEEFASQRRFNILLSNSAQKLEKEESQIKHYYEMGVNGMIIASMTHEYTATPMLRQIHTAQYPYIMVSYIKDPEIYYVGTDHVKGGYLAGGHLLSLGYKKIGYINGEIGNVVGELRLEGFKNALNEGGVAFNTEFMYRLRLRGETHDYHSGYEIGEHFASLINRPEAIFIYNDLSALGFMQAVLDKGFDVPNDIAIIGFDDIERSRIASVPLTTIKQQVGQIGSLAVGNLIKRINGEEVGIKSYLMPELVVRSSTGVGKKQQEDHRDNVFIEPWL